ncbi:MAG: hypothetical protein RLZZ01_532 [Actinomycetota bacterium]
MAAAIAGATVVGVIAWFAVPRDRSTAVDLDEAIDRYRSSTVPTTPVSTTDRTGGAEPTSTSSSTTVLAVPTLPDPGVYRYDTSGGESIDALGGVRHDYPAISTITVTDDAASGGCGRTLRWDVLEERYEIWRLCLDGAVVAWQPTSLQYHEFFEQETPEDVTCDVAVPMNVPGSGPVRQQCILGERDWSPTWEHLGTRDLSVDGEPVTVHHVRMRIDDTDDLPESYVQDWFVRDDGLPVEVTVTKRSVSPNPIGGVVEYVETYRLDLISFDPVR